MKQSMKVSNINVMASSCNYQQDGKSDLNIQSVLSTVNQTQNKFNQSEDVL